MKRISQKKLNEEFSQVSRLRDFWEVQVNKTSGEEKANAQMKLKWADEKLSEIGAQIK